MCGITGFISNNRITIDELTVMNDTMYHRGPDDSGVEIYEGVSGLNVGFAQRRLSILDLSELGHQPMHSLNGRISIVYNGEIYNFLEIKEELKGLGHSFKSDCDTEVIIAAYMQWGVEDAIAKLNGMFAIAIYDRNTQVVYLVRDRIGKKPLYYEVENKNGAKSLFFSSELKPLMARPGFKKEIRREIMSQYLYQQYINAPDTIFRNVYKLEPGSILRYSLKSGALDIRKYWDVKQVYYQCQLNPVSNYKQAKEELKELLKKSVSMRMISDVPLGSFLSGGYDSSLVTAIAQEISSQPVKTFSVGFEDERYNEARYAKQVSEHLGTDHTELIISESDMLELVDSIPQYYDEPFADSSQISTMLVSKLAKEKVTVALSGDGGDEFFCGYNIYTKIRQAQRLDAIGGLTAAVCNLPGLKQLGVLDKLPFKVKVVVANRNIETKTQLGTNNYNRMAREIVMGNQLPNLFLRETSYGVENWQIRRMLLDMDTYLPGDILCKVDRASMKYSLESRCPLLDKDVMEYSFRIDHRFKYFDGDKKHILKDIAYDYIPREMLERPKVGFAVPLDKWLRGPMKEELISYIDKDYLLRQGLFDPKKTEENIMDYVASGDGGPSSGTNYSRLIWAFFVFQKWYQTYM